MCECSLSARIFLNLAEVEVLATGQVLTPTVTQTPAPTNIALGKTASQSTTFNGGIVASRSVDGNTSGVWANNALSSTLSESHPWWQVDLGSNYFIQSVKLWNRTDCCSDRLSNFYIFVSDAPFSSNDLNTTLNQSTVSHYYYSGAAGTSAEISINHSGRYVRIQLSGTNFLTIAEVQVFSTGSTTTPTITPSPTYTLTPTLTPMNVALGKSASQSTTFDGSIVASRSVDGNTSGVWADNVLSSTNSESHPWWQVDLGSSYFIQSVKLWNRTDCCGDRLSNFYVFVSDTPFSSNDLSITLNQPAVNHYYFSGTVGTSTEISINHSGRYVRIQLFGTNFLTLAEVQVFSTGAMYTPTMTPSPTPINYALGKTGSQSSTYNHSVNPVAAKAIDGNTDGVWANSSLASTNNEVHPWWQVDMGGIYQIQTIKLWNRTDAELGRLSNFYVLVSDTPFSSDDLDTVLAQSGVWSYYYNGTAGALSEISVGTHGRYVRAQLSGTNILTLAEVQVFGY